jgi:lactoylglutathione lyase
MKFGYTIIYVPDVTASLIFFEKAFGFPRRFLHESGDYGELETGSTTLAFASHELGAMNFPSGYVAANNSAQPLGVEVAFVTPSVAEAHAQALAVGATEVKALAFRSKVHNLTQHYWLKPKQRSRKELKTSI